MADPIAPSRRKPVPQRTPRRTEGLYGTMIASVVAALLMGQVETYSQLLLFGFFTGIALASLSVGCWIDQVLRRRRTSSQVVQQMTAPYLAARHATKK